ncbi:MAG: LysR family transcriptional regulator [Bacillota bacterium]|nr:LysR family transcriptional regulator [Bacillota bacterium]
MATLKQLKTFVCVAEYKKMSEAAKRLYISQPTVSQMISELEAEYGISLFERNHKILTITAAGKLLLSSAQEIISLSEQLDQNMKSLKSKRFLRVGATLTIGNTLISTIVSKLTELYPDIDVTVFVDNTRSLEQKMIHNELDIALVEGIIVREEILIEPIINDTLKVICGKKSPFYGRESVKIEELANQDFIMREKGSGTRAIFENIMIRNHIPFVTRWESCSGTAILDAVQHNLGLGVLSERCIQEALQKGSVHSFNIENVYLGRKFHICFNKNHPISSQMEDFIKVVKESQGVNSCGVNCFQGG